MNDVPNMETNETISRFNCDAICEHHRYVQYKTIAKKKFADIKIFFS